MYWSEGYIKGEKSSKQFYICVHLKENQYILKPYLSFSLRVIPKHLLKKKYNKDHRICQDIEQIAVSSWLSKKKEWNSLHFYKHIKSSDAFMVPGKQSNTEQNVQCKFQAMAHI